MPNLRSHASRAWRESQTALKDATSDSSAKAVEAAAFWDWAILELLLQSGLRIEEASELTALDILKRRLPDGSLYYMLHIKPSKFDRARVIPIGDGLGRVLAEILQHVKSFYGTTEVPFVIIGIITSVAHGPLVHTCCRAPNTPAPSAFKPSEDGSRQSPLPAASSDLMGLRLLCFHTIAAASLRPST